MINDYAPMGSQFYSLVLDKWKKFPSAAADLFQSAFLVMKSTIYPFFIIRRPNQTIKIKVVFFFGEKNESSHFYYKHHYFLFFFCVFKLDITIRILENSTMNTMTENLIFTLMCSSLPFGTRSRTCICCRNNIYFVWDASFLIWID